MKKVFGFLAAMVAACGLAWGAGSTPIQNLVLVGPANGNGQSFTNLNNVTLTGSVTFVSGTNVSTLTAAMVATLAGTAPTNSLVALYAKTPTNGSPSYQVATVGYVLNHVASNAAYASVAGLATNALMATNSYRLGGIAASFFPTNNQRSVNFGTNLMVAGIPVLTNAPPQLAPTNWASYPANTNVNMAGNTASNGSFVGNGGGLTNVSADYAVDAGNANYASSAGYASVADLATNALTATNSYFSTNAYQLGGIAASVFLTNNQVNAAFGAGLTVGSQAVVTNAVASGVNSNMTSNWTYAYTWASGSTNSPAAWSLYPATNNVSLNNGVNLTGSTLIQTTITSNDISRTRSGVAVSSNGLILLSYTSGSGYQVSIDGGANWTARAPGAAAWCGASMSYDGSRMIIAIYNGHLWRSVDSGSSWSEVMTGPWICWGQLASSADGTRWVGAENNNSGTGIYISTDGGSTWAARDSTRWWTGVASSADGVKLAATVSGGTLYTSSNGGTNWVTRDTTRAWQFIASSADGNTLLASTAPGFLYVSSDSGVTWNPKSISTNWYGVAISGDGSKMAACAYGASGRLYVSIDYGISWTPMLPDRNWNYVGMSFSGNRIVATEGIGLVTVIDVGTVTVSDLSGFHGIDGQVLTQGGVPVVITSDSRYSASITNNQPSVNLGTNLQVAGVPVLTNYLAGTVTNNQHNVNLGTNLQVAGIPVLTNAASWSLYPATNNVSLSNGVGIVGSSTNMLSESTNSAFFSWACVANNSNGTRIIATKNPGGIWVSPDSGVTWAEMDATARDYNAVASSEDGTVLAACNGGAGAYIYVSVNAGTNWAEVGPAKNWQDIACSRDGARMIAAAAVDVVYVSIDYGATWSATAGLGNKCVGTSWDGSKLVSGSSSFLYTSSNGGTNWTQRQAGSFNNLASSYDGTRLIASGFAAYIYCSTNAGTNWVLRESNRFWDDCTISTNGAIMAAVVNGGKVYFSANGGTNWNPYATSRTWTHLTGDDSGLKYYGTANAGGGTYVFGLDWVAVPSQIGGCAAAGDWPVNGNLLQLVNAWHYFGMSNANNSWRIGVSGSNLIMQTRLNGLWTNGLAVTPPAP